MLFNSTYRYIFIKQYILRHCRNRS